MDSGFCKGNPVWTPAFSPGSPDWTSDGVEGVQSGLLVLWRKSSLDSCFWTPALVKGLQSRLLRLLKEYSLKSCFCSKSSPGSCFS